MAVAYIECAAGASGDMFLGAWLDLGVSESALRTELAKLAVTDYELSVRRVLKKGVSATKVDVIAKESHHHRHLPDIERIIDESGLSAVVVAKSKEAFHHLAVAEASVHATTPDKIHFHEVGAVDAIVDIVGSMIAWDLLGQPECVVSPIEVGGGTVNCAHGVMPVPAPATAQLLQGYATYSSGLWGETTTPTGAVIVKTLARSADRRPFIATGVGYGAGTKDFDIANVLRIQLGAWATDAGAATAVEDGQADAGLGLPKPIEAVVIEANVDDMSAELAGHVVERFLQMGAMDVTWAPIVMKKGRPAMQLQVLCGKDRVAALQTEIFRQTSSIGLRTYAVDKWELSREVVCVETPYGAVDVKVARLMGNTVNIAPEFEVCRRLAEKVDVPLKQVYQAASAAASQMYQR